MLKKYYSKYGGIIIGGLYGLLMRIIFDIGFTDSTFKFADLFSITFVWIVPIIVGITPLIFASKEQLSKLAFRIFSPILSVLTFFAFCFITKLEDIICLIIIALPFLIIAGIAGLIVGHFILRKKIKNKILYALFMLPFITGFIEPNFSTPLEYFQTTSSSIINATQDDIWKQIVRVNKISDAEYKKGIFNYAGIPRPLFAELNKDTLGGIRIGHFEGGLKFEEKIIDWKKNNKITFDIKIIPSTTHSTIFEKHMLNGKHFNFLNATYQLITINNTQTQLLLTTKYQLNTKINFYGSFWAKHLLTDFQNRLLHVLKTRCEQ